MRLNLAIATFAVVSLALTSGCAAKFAEDEANDPSLNPRSGELANVTEGAKTPIGEKQTQIVDVNADQYEAKFNVNAPQLERDKFVKGTFGPAAGVPDIKERMDADQQLKRSTYQISNGATGGVGNAQTSTDVD